jgi:hypothetical protein
MWLVDGDCVFYGPSPNTFSDEPTSVHEPPYDFEESIATLITQFSHRANAVLTDLTEARPLIRTELTVKTFDDGHRNSGLVHSAATLDFVSKDFV